jgi:hypothetical protein
LASIPSNESILAFVRDVLQAGPADKKRKEFEQLRRRSDIQIETTGDYIQEILSALRLDEPAESRARQLFFNWSKVNNFLERSIWVSHASSKHVIWLLSTHVYAPGLGRQLAFWDLARRTDPGMPGGRFWYLPAKFSETDQKLTMPITQVINWLLDLLACSVDELAVSLGSSRTIAGRGNDMVADARSIRKTLHSWYAGTQTPGINKILEFFNEKLLLQFHGVFHWNPTESLDENFDRARAFLRRKGLTAHDLSVETPIPKAMAGKILDNLTLSSEEKYDFCYQLCQRYQAPSPQIIRKRLLYARAFQATYFQLASALCIPKSMQNSASPSENPAMQVIKIFEIAYNLTIDSSAKSDDDSNEYGNPPIFSGVQK